MNGKNGFGCGCGFGRWDAPLTRCRDEILNDFYNQATVQRPLLALLLFAALGLRAQIPTVVALQPLGPVDAGLVRGAAQHLEALYVVTVVILPARPLPAAAYYPPRRRYRAERLLDWLDAQTPPQYQKVVGITAVDISTDKPPYPDWGIFGLAYLSRRPAVVSLFRLRRGRVPRAKIAARLDDVAAHELGHTFGLEHCPHPHCIMEDAQGTIRSVDESEGRFCTECAKKLGRLLRSP